jgi:transposase
MARNLFWLSDEAWEALSPHLPRGSPGKPRVDGPHRHLGHPTRLEDRMPVARRSLRLWAADNDLQPLQSLVPAPHLAAHCREDGGHRPGSRRTFRRKQPRQSAPLGEWLKKGEFEEAIGRSRGGRTSKIHALVDDRGRPVAFALTPGNVADVIMAIPLLDAVAKPKRVLVDKAYGADSLRR